MAQQHVRTSLAAACLAAWLASPLRARPSVTVTLRAPGQLQRLAEDLGAGLPDAGVCILRSRVGETVAVLDALPPLLKDWRISEAEHCIFDDIVCTVQCRRSGTKFNLLGDAAGEVRGTWAPDAQGTALGKVPESAQTLLLIPLVVDGDSASILEEDLQAAQREYLRRRRLRLPLGLLGAMRAMSKLEAKPSLPRDVFCRVRADPSVTYSFATTDVGQSEDDAGGAGGSLVQEPMEETGWRQRAARVVSNLFVPSVDHLQSPKKAQVERRPGNGGEDTAQEVVITCSARAHQTPEVVEAGRIVWRTPMQGSPELRPVITPRAIGWCQRAEGAFGEQEATGLAVLVSMFVDPSFRGRGLGYLLILEGVRRCRHLGFSHIMLTPQDTGAGSLVRFYTDLGFAWVPELEKTMVADVETVLLRTAEKIRATDGKARSHV